MDTINTSIDTNSVDKKKKSFFPKLFIAMTSVLSIIGFGASLLIKDTYKSARAFSYDDEGYTITLIADELNNYTFDNLLNLLPSIYEDFTDSFVVYNEDSFSLIGADDVSFSFAYNSVPVIGFGDTSINTNLNKFFYTEDEEYLGTFSLPVEFYFNSAIYAEVKQAIELDISANQPYDNNTFLQDIIELLVGGIGVTASGIGNGLSVLVSNITIQNGAMSPFMAIVLIFGGIALALALSRWVVNLIGSLGQRNR